MSSLWLSVTKKDLYNFFENASSYRGNNERKLSKGSGKSIR